MSWKNVRWVGAVVVMLGMAVGAWAQSPVQEPPPPGFPGGGRPGVFSGRPGPGQGPGPMGGVFSFVEPVGENAKVVTDAPFSAQVVRESKQKLADGNLIERKSTGTIARDVAGRTRREMTLENIGPLAAAGKAPHLVFINDPVAGKVYTLDENRKTAIEMNPPKFKWKEKEGQRPRRAQREAEFKSEINTESLGRKTIEGVQVEGTRITRMIPAGQIGNAKPIVITTERWYSPDLQTTVLLTRSDPRFGTTTYQLTNIDRTNPPQSLFAVPSDYTIKQGRRMRRRMRHGRRGIPGPPPMLP